VKQARSQKRILGMTPTQLVILIALLVLFCCVVIGAIVILATSNVFQLNPSVPEQPTAIIVTSTSLPVIATEPQSPTPTATDTPLPAPTEEPPPTASPTPAWTDTSTPSPTPEPSYARWPMYENQDCGFSIHYPPESISAEPLEGIARFNFPLLDDNTNLSEKFLDIGCYANTTSCAFSSPQFTTSTQTFNGIDFTFQDGGEAGAGNIYITKDYTTTHGDACIRLTFVLHSTNALHYDPPKQEYDETAESQIFGEIMSSFQWFNP
jgi:hypothetical protein